MSEALLEVSGLVAGYGVTDVLRGVDLGVAPGEIVAVLGSNGVGKTTLNKVLSGLIRPRAGNIRFDGADITRATPRAIVEAGLIHVPEGRKIFSNLDVRDNLDMGCFARGRARREANRERIYAIFPLVEQNVVQSLALADHASVLENGLVALAGPAKDLAADPGLQKTYLGL